jgi:hypothetical protein
VRKADLLSPKMKSKPKACIRKETKDYGRDKSSRREKQNKNQ